jgi:hypothetical protein
MRLLLFLAGFCLSATAAYYSIIGLTALFSGAFYPILIMGGSLEFAKLVTASWLYRSWRQVSWFMKTYMSIAVIVLMLITSMGIFGFLSKAHLENSANKNADVTAEYASIRADVDQDNKIVADIDKQLEKLDSTVKEDYNTMVRQRKLRNQLAVDKKEAQSRLRENNRKLAAADLQVKKVEVEVGPLKYIADLIYGENAKDHLDGAVRAVIFLLIFVFDPLAVLLLIAASKKEKIVEDDKSVTIAKTEILNLEKHNE